MTVRFWRIGALIAFGWYLFLAVLHFANQRPLWNDEQCVFLSIQSFSSADLFHRELLSLQVFPRAYLWMVQHFSGWFDYSLSSLRFLSFVSMVGAFWVWAFLAEEHLNSDRLLALFLLSWTASTPLVYYASELKQYSLDVLVCGFFVFLLFRHKRLASTLSPEIYCAGLFLLPFIGLLSYPAFLFLIFPLWQMLCSKGRGRAPLSFYLLGCLIAAGLSFWFDMRLRPLAVVDGYKDYFISFASVGEFLRTFQEGINNLIGRWFASKPSWVRSICRSLMLLGCLEIIWGLWDIRRRKPTESPLLYIIAGVLSIELAILGALKAYPFTVPRTSLFYCPLLFLMTVKALKRIEAVSKKGGKVLQVIYGVAVMFFALIVTRMALFASVGQDMTQWLRF